MQILTLGVDPNSFRGSGISTPWTQVAAAAESRCSANDDKLDANGMGPNLQQAFCFGHLVI